jgi:hypothetical protein
MHAAGRIASLEAVPLCKSLDAASKHCELLRKIRKRHRTCVQSEY